MERDVVVMIYGAIMGIIGSILTAIISALFHFWLERREFERRRSQAGVLLWSKPGFPGYEPADAFLPSLEHACEHPN